MLRTAIIMPTHNALPQLRATLEALAWAKHRDDVELVVADAASSDGTPQFLAAETPWARVVHGEDSMWWAASTNAGCRFAQDSLRCDAVCLLNHDCLFTEAAFDGLLHDYQRSPTDLIACRVEAGGDDQVLFAGGTQSWTGMLTMRGVRAPASTRFPSGRVAWCGGMGVMLGARLWQRLGGFDDGAFPHYFADTDFCLRARTLGASVRYRDDLLVINDRSSSGIRIEGNDASLQRLLESLVSRRSPYRVADAARFYRRHLRFRWPLALGHLYAMHLGSGLKRIVSRYVRERCRP